MRSSKTMHSTASSVRPVPTAEEEEETDTAFYRYVPRTLQQGGPFYGSVSQGKFADSDRGGSRSGSTKHLDSGRTENTDEGHAYKTSRFRPHHVSTDEFTGPPHNLAAAFQYEDLSNGQEGDNESGQSNSSHSMPETDAQSRNLNSDDIDIKSIHGEDHYGKLETTPIADNQDRLWTQIDALDDVKKLASSMNLYDGFPPGFEEQLSKLREAHSQLLTMMRDRDALLEEERDINGNDTESARDFGVRMDKAMSNGFSHVGGRPTGNGETNSVDPKRPGSSASAGAGAGAGASANSVLDANTSANANASVSSTKSQKPSRREKRSTAPSMTGIDEDKYVQEMIGIIKQLRA
ncbi:ZYRO0A13024p [Zygosaccharomyces rouxii]|uniref:ZYRO0A13024p n=1 Tax=Zygosaccharomyces rouxii (strain ATCC 2623 / CBS 732 / NBRC 1130 / NCYC 568 / NRRL Y-229) TaxID=559307 RepID=C5DP00_ZYGRC|nr:uncharacterized protein ZYRO0A13024g [Zygosaccharomyces rouxii]KAH9198486.1 hypothetical protein LQ764DRAFT_235511 [Zygosaccharomyces rouxii]CAR25991.1 ZYRO0A13024p [Zygosaccharomyces rouxii]